MMHGQTKIKNKNSILLFYDDKLTITDVSKGLVAAIFRIFSLTTLNFNTVFCSRILKPSKSRLYTVSNLLQITVL